MGKQLFSLFISFFVLFGSFGGFALGEEEEKQVTGFGFEKAVTSEKPVFLMDFEGYGYAATSATGFDKTQGASCFPDQGDPQYGTYFSSATNTSFTAFKALDAPITSGSYLLSFDFKRANQEGTFYLRPTLSTNDAISRENVYETFTCSGANLGYYNSSYGWTVGNPLKFQGNSWYHIAMWMNFDTGIIYHYINNEFRGSTSMPKSAYGFWFINESTTGINVTSIDNLSLFQVTPAFANEVSAAGINAPEEEKSVIGCTVTSASSGNIFTSFDEVKLDVEHSNRADEEVSYDVQYSVQDYQGETVWSAAKKGLKLQAGESFADTVKPKVSLYDIYTLTVSFQPASEKYAPSEADVQFSVVNAPSREFSSERYGGCIHISKGATKWDQIKDSIDVLGIGWLRDDFSWNNYEYQKGKYGFQGEWGERMNRFVTEASQMGIKVLAIWFPTNSKYGATSSIPRTKEQLDAMEEACARFAAEYKGRIDSVEFGNELNFNRQDAMSCAEYATALQSFYRGIKRGNPDAVVVAGGCSRAAADWIQRVLEQGGKGYCDAVSIHPYQEAGTPESKQWDVYCKEVRTAMDAAGCQDVELWTTEGNTSSAFSYNTEQQQGMNLIRQLAQCDGFQVQDKFLWYQMQTVDNDEKDNEACFGILRGPAVKNAYGAKPAYLATANFFARTENAVFVDSIQYDNVWIYRYRKPDGRYLLMLYSDRECKATSLSLGAAEGTLYDMNGNAQTLASPDGKYTFAISDEPSYFEYSGEEFERCEETVSVSKSMMELTVGSTGVFRLTVPEGASVSVKARKELLTEVQQNGRGVTVSVTAKEMPSAWAYTERRQDYGTQLFRDFADVTVVKDGANYAQLPLAVEYIKQQADISMTVLPYDSVNMRYWKGIVKVKNNNEQKVISGTIVMKTPDALANGFRPIEVKELKPGEESGYSFRLPPQLTTSTQYFSGVLTLKDGTEIPFSLGDEPRSYAYQKNGGTNIKYLKKVKGTAPVIDGVIDAAEWKNYKITDFDKSQVSYGSTGLIIAGVVERETFGKDADYGGKADFSGSIFSQWDDEFLYYAAIVYDDIHFQKDDPRSFYLNDVFYINLCPSKTQRHDTRIDLALSDFFSDGKGRLYRNWSQLFDVPVGGIMPESENGVQAKVVRNDTVTIYEARIPWRDIIGERELQSKNFSLSFGIRDYDGDRDKSFGYGGWYCLTDPKN